MKKSLTFEQLYAISTKQERVEFAILLLGRIEKRQKREAIHREIKAKYRQLLAEISETWATLSWPSKRILRLKFEWFLFLSRFQVWQKKARPGNRYIT